MAELLKNLYTKEYINSLSLLLSKNYSSFNSNNFINNVFDSSWQNLELKQRMRHINNCMYNHLPKDYEKAIFILKNTYNEILNKKDKSEALQNMIFQDYVEIYGLDNCDISINAMQTFTLSSTCEFAIRQYILKYEDKTMKQMLLWAKDSNEEIRRLASEGCRPRLPWAFALPIFKKDPSKVLEVLDILQDDTAMYVKKSVANNLNDISKDHEDIVIDIAKKWYGQNEHKNWIIKHACRTLLKQGNQEILTIFGYKQNKSIILDNFKMQDDVTMGENIEFSFNLSDEKNLGKLRIEYSIDFVRLNNKSNNKVFFIAQKEFNESSKTINKKHSFKLINTRKYYAGIHKINIIINGIIMHTQKFELKEKKNDKK